jgi:hypothetical protein
LQNGPADKSANKTLEQEDFVLRRIRNFGVLVAFDMIPYSRRLDFQDR